MRNLTSLHEQDRVVRRSLRLFWKIIVEGNGDSLRAVKELSLWGDASRNGGPLRNCRLMWKQIPLQVEIGRPDIGGRHRDQDRICVEDGYIHFQGGYLKIFDTSLIEDVRVWGLELDPATAESIAVVGLEPGSLPVSAITDYSGQIEGVPKFEEKIEQYQPEEQKEYLPDSIRPNSEGPAYYAGYNVRLEVEFAAARGENDDEGNPVRRFHPLFFYPQDPDPTHPAIGHVSLGLVKTGDSHELIWDISGSSFTPKNYHLEEFHTVTINQETEEPDKPKFEFLADAISLGKDGNLADDAHLFSKSGRFFYVGSFPNEAEEPMPPFRGYIKRLMFDPNASCGSC